MKKTYITPNIKVRIVSERESIMQASGLGTESATMSIDKNRTIDGTTITVGAKKNFLWDNFGDDEE